MNKKNVVIIGAGALGKQLAHYLYEDGGYRIEGFLDDFAQKGVEVEKGWKILGSIVDLPQIAVSYKLDEIFLGIGYKHMKERARVFAYAEKVIPFGCFIHKTAIVDSTAFIDKGAFVYPGSIVGPHSKIGKAVLLNQQVSIAHDSQVEDFCMIAPSVSLAGCVRIGEASFLGIGSIVIDNCTIAPNSIIGAGAVVTSSLEDASTYVGIPAKKILK